MLIDGPMRVQLVESEDAHYAERLGMLTMQQVAGKLLPYIANGEIMLEETIVVDVRSESSVSGVFPSGNA